eukprot:TRINITY_DN1132_c0_g1_i3.p1 TRINITY_DN1132_c0_g1~~TRINITY_DN1132_c0_g1_i3.p1  ORF type:complete len:202 (+),score=30.27 TRINITY_DN1132_c0_g1_i3:53-607(+)
MSSAMEVDGQPFEFPPIYNFPPFFTFQISLSTRQKQEEMWRELIISYTRFYKINEINLSKFANEGDLFQNKSINRKLTYAQIQSLIEVLIASGNAEWIDAAHSRARIIWRTLNEWADIVWQYVERRHFQGVICTVYELIHGDSNEDEEFYGVDEDVFLKILQVLEARGKAAIFYEGGKPGVKFS